MLGVGAVRRFLRRPLEPGDVPDLLVGVEFKVCGLAAEDYDYDTDDFHEFIEVVPSAITELAHWQLQGHALITPTVVEKKISIEEIR